MVDLGVLSAGVVKKYNMKKVFSWHSLKLVEMKVKRIHKQSFTLAAIMLIAISVSAQVEDGFGDMDFLNNPTWVGDTSQFKINTTHQLQLKSAGTDTSYLSTRNSLLKNTEWRFWVKLSFNTSANNYARVYLASDQPDLTNSLDGYYLQIGGSNDSLAFYKQNGTLTEKLFQGAYTNTAHSTNVLRIKIIHDSTGLWHLFSDTLGGTNFVEEGSYLQNQVLTTAWFGVYCRYTTSNSAKFYFDDFFIGQVQIDTLPPSLNALTVIDSREIEIMFSENVDKNNAEEPSHYSTIFAGAPLSVSVDLADPRKVTLKFQHDFAEGVSDTLTISEIIDLDGNHSPMLRIPFCLYHEKSFDLLISEIMADPDPVVGLPSCEYVELYNRTKYPINLKDWIFRYGSHSKIFPDLTISPFEFLILTHGDSLKGFGRCLDMFSSASILSNEGIALVIKNKSGKIIHGVSYSKDWYQSALKENGGWSLEMIDPNNPCGCLENWRASTSALGGTPGGRNSVQADNPDRVGHYLKRARIIPDRQIELFFSEPMDSLSLSGVNNWATDHGFDQPDSLTFIPPEFNRLKLWYSDPFQKGIQYTINGKNGPMDCAMNKLDTSKSVYAALPDSTQPGDIVINEILSNPATGGERFVEIYNRSQKVLNLNDLVIASFDTIQNTMEKPTEIVAEEFLCFPGDYFVLTRDPRDIQSRYFTPTQDVFIELKSMPSYQDDQDVVVIARKNDGIIIDEVKYSKEMFFPLLNYTDGISLERINPILPSKEKSNWHSASESCGFATPGYKNSQYRGSFSGEDWVTIIPSIFSPDNDGKDDFLSLVLHPDRPGYYVTITVFDTKGRKARQLVNNRLLSAEEQIVWDGTDDNRQKATLGIYILYVEFLHPDGNKKLVKKAVVLAGVL